MKTTALPIIGMDIAKNVFQLHIVDPETGEIERLKLKRDRVVAFFANRQPSPSLVAAEACGGAHHWGRALQSQGHQVKLLPPKQVRPFVSRDKTDARDAQAIWVAAQQPHIFEVPVKSEQQQACLTLHRMRAQLMKIRIMQTNALRGLLYEFGIVLPEGHRILLNRIQRAPEARLDRWASPSGGGRLCAKAVDAWGQSHHCQESENGLDHSVARQTALQLCGRRVGQQAGAHRLGGPDQRQSL